MATLLKSASTTRAWFLNLNRETRSVIVAYFLVVALIVFGGLLVTPNFFSPEFLLQQLREASFLGIIAAGQMTVILTGNIDLSVSWTLNLAAVVATSIANGKNELLIPAVVIALLLCLLLGIINGIAAAHIRIPSMVLTLGTNTILMGILVIYTVAAPQFQTTPELLTTVSTEVLCGLIPLPALVWVSLSIFITILLHRSSLGRKIYALRT